MLIAFVVQKRETKTTATFNVSKIYSLYVSEIAEWEKHIA